jgi:hypothetical protein
MKINEIVTEDASGGATASGNFAPVSMPMTPGTTKKQQKQAVDPFGYTVNKKKNKKSKDPVYNVPVLKR